MNDDDIEGLRIVLLALLPPDGSLMTVGSLARATRTRTFEVTRALEADRIASRVQYDGLMDGFRAIKQGDAL